MDLAQIKELLDLIAESSVNEVTIEEKDFKIKVKKAADPAEVRYEVQSVAMPSPLPPATSTVAGAVPGGATSNSGSSDATSSLTGNPGASPAAPAGDTVKSPLVGTFYEAPSPDADPFVRVGDTVQAGDTLCIVEAMKIMNEIKADFAGEVVKVVATNGQAVEFDQPLFIIKKN